MIATAVATNGINHHASALTSQRLRGGRRIGGQRHCGSGNKARPDVVGRNKAHPDVVG